MNRRTFCAILPAAGVLRPVNAASPRPLREKRLFDHQWKFLLGDPSGAESPGFDAGGWRALDLHEQTVCDGRILTGQTWQSHPFFYREIFSQLAVEHRLLLKKGIT